MSCFDNLKEIPKEKWVTLYINNKRLRCYAGDTYIVQVINEGNMIHRLSVQRKDLKDGISWDALQEIKNAVGYADFDAVEVYPKHDDVLNVGNYRHLWIMPTLLPFAWRVNKDPDSFCLRYVQDAAVTQ